MKDKKIGVLIGLTACCILIVGLVILFAGREGRLIKKADSLYNAGKYEEAAVTYEKALGKGHNEKAVYGLVASLMTYDKEAAKGKLVSATDTMCKAGLKLTEGQKKILTELFLLTPEIMADDNALCYETLVKGFELLEKPGELKPALADAALSVGKYDEALLYSDGAESVKEAIEKLTTK